MTIAMRGGQGPVEPPEVQQPPPPQLLPIPVPSVDEGVEEGGGEELAEGAEPDFPHIELARLDEMISNPRWVVPVLPKGQLEILLEASVDPCQRGVDTRCEACQRFFREGLTISFTKILTDEAVSSWKFEIHRCILKNCEKLIELCVVKLSQDWFPLLDLLAMVFNPTCKFHTFNASRQSETVPPTSQLADDELFARPIETRNPKGWLIDLINRFGNLGGFQILLERFQGGESLTVPVIYALLRPFGQCYEVLTVHTVVQYFMPIVEMVPDILDSLTDEELKKEAKNETKNDAISAIIKVFKSLVSKVSNQEERIKSLEMFRLKMILRLLQISSFNGKMNALNEINKVIAGVSYFPHRHSGLEEEEWLTAERMADWIKENKVLHIVLRDSLHQPQYVEKLEKIIRFVIKERALTLEDLDNIWEAQVGKHEAIVKNVHDLLAKLAWDFQPEQLDHLFECFQASWTNATKKQREKLMELIRRLAEDDKDGVMAHKVLTLFWNLAHSDDVPTEIVDQALSAHAKILDYSCSQNRDTQKTQWLDRCVEELKRDKWVLPALKHIKEICCQYTESPPNVNHPQKSSHSMQEVISHLQNQHSLVVLVANNLTEFMKKVRGLVKEKPCLDPTTFMPDNRYDHTQQVQMRLNFLRFLLKDGQLWLCEPQAKQIWQCLAEHAVFVCDREACFKWFSKLMGDEPDLDPEINRDFFEQNILQLDPTLLTESGMRCFERFFKAVNSKEGKLIAKRKVYLMDDVELIGSEYLWRVVIFGNEEIASRAIELLKETYTNLGPKLQSSQAAIHEDFISSCVDRLRASYDTISVIERDKDSVNRVRQEVTRMCRVLKVLQEYVGVCDGDFGEDRTAIPLYRAYRGKHLVLIIRFPNQGRQMDDFEMWTHTNETLGALRRQILQRMKVNSSNMKLELFSNGDTLDANDDGKLVSQIPLRDKMLLTAKLCQVNSNMPSSPDSSSDSSTGSPQHPYDGPNVEAENCLPGVIMSQRSQYAQFLFQMADLGCSLQHPLLRDSARNLLKLMPASAHIVEKLRTMFLEHNKKSDNPPPTVESVFFGASPSEVLYHLEVLYSLLMPAANNLTERSFDFQYSFFNSGEASVILDMLTKNNFLCNADIATRKSAYLAVLRKCKLYLTVVAQVMMRGAGNTLGNGTTNSESSSLTDSGGRGLALLRQALHQLPNPTSECMLRNVASRVSQTMIDKHRSGNMLGENLPAMMKQVNNAELPDQATIRTLIKLAWTASTGSLVQLTTPFEELKRNKDRIPDFEDVQVCKEALEAKTLAFVLNPRALEVLVKDKTWHSFIIDMLLLCRNRSVRVAAAEQFLLMATRCTLGQQPLQFFITLLFTVLGTTVKENAHNSHEYFQLLCRLLSCATSCQCHLPIAENLLNNEITWLKNIKENVKNTGETQVDEALLEGHLGITRELVSFLTPDKKYEIGADPKKDGNLIRDIMDEFIFPASRLMLRMHQSGDFPEAPSAAVCSTPHTVVAACDVLVSLCTGCVPNLQLVVDSLTNMFYSDNDDPLLEWEYLPPVGPRSLKGFVGLKNAGATCYMNSVLQQLYMVESIRWGILEAQGAATDMDDDFNGEERLDGEGTLETNENDCNDDKTSIEESRKEYNIGILKQVQAIFGHLAYSKLQYYVPRGLWKHFKLQGEPVNLREQQDAVEFFMSLVESLDEALKALGQDQIMSKTLGGSYSDQKICKGCPHRYSKEEPYSVISVDIRNQSNLLDSLEQYVKGELLEGADAYHCEKCNKKVVTVKRLCVKKLPPILAIQLKRFEYDYERVCAIKFNDYFEFPRDLDMEPYTVSGLAKIEGEVIDCDYNESGKECGTKYHLTGIVVHSGQASGGHYYSYIMHRAEDNACKWYKFDDGEVTECKMDDDEEMKNQCFGGEYMGEVFDHMMKRMSYRRQKRWWNAYILFYTRSDVEESNVEKCLRQLSLAAESKTSMAKMPSAIERSVQRQNVKFMHNRNQFSPEFFQFMRKLVNTNVGYVTVQPGMEVSARVEELSMLSVQMTSRFLFHTGFHTKKTLRGPAADWYDALCHHLRTSAAARHWFAHNMLFAHPHRFCEYLLECPSAEVRSAFVKILVFLAHFSQNDGLYNPPPVIIGALQTLEGPSSLSDYILQAVLALLRREVSENDRHLPQYFNLFVMYASLGLPEKKQLIKLNVPATFILVSMDEGPGPPIKYQYAELNKLYQVVCMLVRCYDVSNRMQTFQQFETSPTSLEQVGIPLKNPHGDPLCPEGVMPIHPQVAELFYGKTRCGVRSAFTRDDDEKCFVKKLIEETSGVEETIKALKYCCWENPDFSHVVLVELLWQVAFTYTHELRPHLDLLLHILLLEDSWQSQRILNALKGIPDERDGIFDTIQRNKNHYQKRAYQCIKCLVTLFSNCALALQIMQSNADLKRKWVWAVEWLHEELERRPYAPNAQYGYNNWSPPAQSNETSNGYFLERSNSARMTLGKALELCPEEEAEGEDVSEEGDSPPPEDQIKSPPPSYPATSGGISPPPATATTTIVTVTTNSHSTFGLPTQSTTHITPESFPPITVRIPADNEEPTNTTTVIVTTTETEP